jgi:putative Mg2+ transporter-C (MgtC) family protein
MSDIDYELFTLLPFLLPKLLVATICGAIVGYDREIKQKTAGIRTNILICVGCALFTAFSFYIAKSTNNIDPTRIIGQIITGIGFLGAGVIMKHDDKIVGVTTAAFIWVVSAIGVLVGIGSYITPIILTVGLVIISRIFERVEKYIKKQQENK